MPATRKQLVAAGNELNELLFKDDPQIDTKAKPADLTAQLIEAAVELDKDDKVTPETIATLCEIDAKLPKGMAPESKKETPAKKGKAKAKKSKAKISVEQLVAAAEDINALEGVTEKIDTADGEDIAKNIIDASGMIEFDDLENLSTETLNVLKALKVSIPAKPKGKATGKKKDAPAKEEKVSGKKTLAETKSAKVEKCNSKTSKPPSNKELVWKAWKNGNGETDPEKLNKTISNNVQTSTIKTWLKQWAADNNLPACAKK